MYYSSCNFKYNKFYTLYIRLEVVHAFLSAGISLSKLAPETTLYKFLERTAGRHLTGREHLQRDYAPRVRSNEIAILKEEIKDRPICVTFDETTMKWICFCVIFTFVDKEFTIQRRVVRLSQYKSAPDEKKKRELSSMILNVIETVYEHPRHLVKVFSMDGVAVNGSAITKLIGGTVRDLKTPGETTVTVFPPQFSYAVGVKCLSHTTNRAAADYTSGGVTRNRLNGPHVSKFLSDCQGLFHGSSKTANAAWLRYADSAFPSKSPTRWFSAESCAEYILPRLIKDTQSIKSLRRFFKECKDELGNGTHATSLYNTFVKEAPGYSARKLAYIMMEIALSVDVSKVFREATYIFEGDGPIALIGKDIIDRVDMDINTYWEGMEYGNVLEAIERMEKGVDGVPMFPDEYPPVPGRTVATAWKNYCRDISRPAIEYFRENVLNHGSNYLLEAAALANPNFMRRSVLSAVEVRKKLQPLVDKLITHDHFQCLMQQFSSYKLVAMDENWSSMTTVETLTKIIEYWKNHHRAPAWQKFAHLCYLIQTSSACVERAFSMLKYIYTDQKTKQLADATEGSLMLRYNRR